ncbi:MAG: ABC transporter permease [Cytophagaceae bacterium]|nr:ABC transporter permease [Cytophagaceae bacterium]MDW8457268.1 permease-like cell division protein FtsX [Cytophagaceae bacterium]
MQRHKKTLGSYPSLMVMFSITMSLTVLGLFALILIHAGSFSRLIKENIEMNVYLNENISDSLRMEIESTLMRKRYTQSPEGKTQIRYISKEEANKIFVETYGEDFTKILSDSPLPASYVLKIHPEYSDSVNMRQIAAQIAQLPGVREVDYQEDLINKINNNIRTAGLILAVSAVVLIFVSVLLINNTIRLAFYSQRFLIRSMQLVGATRWFIQKPFLSRALIQGALSGIVSVLLLSGMLYIAYSELRELAELRQTEYIASVFASLIVLGGAIGFLSSYRAVHKYLNMSLDELY